MGAQFIEGEIKTQSKKVFLMKYNELVEESQQEFGTDPYNGTWSTMDGVQIILDPCPEMTRWNDKKKNKVLDVILSRSEKWEAALAVKTTTGYIFGGWAST